MRFPDTITPRIPETLTNISAKVIPTMWKEVEVDTWINNRTSSLEGVRENVTEIIGRVQKLSLIHI